MELLPQSSNLLLVQAGEREHTDLVGDVIPGARCAELLELAAENFPHVNDTARHGAQVLLPLGKEGGVVENDRSHLGAVDRRV